MEDRKLYVKIGAMLMFVSADYVIWAGGGESCVDSDLTMWLMDERMSYAIVGDANEVGDGGNAVVAPLGDGFFCAVATQNDQNLAAGQQRPVHGVEHIGIQLVIEGGVEQQAFACCQVIAAADIVHIGLQAGIHFLTDKSFVMESL